MKENVFDVLIYLFENYMEDDSALVPDADAIRTELLEAGFQQPEVNKAFDWLESLADHQKFATTSPAFRVFSDEESIRMDTECRGFLLFLEQTGILTSANRELVIDRLMALHGDDEITLDNLKWVVLMVLFSQPEEEIAFARMEDLVYENIPTILH